MINLNGQSVDFVLRVKLKIQVIQFIWKLKRS